MLVTPSSTTTEVTIPKTVTSVEEYAFDGCTALATVNYGGKQAEWDAVMIADNNDPLLAATVVCAEVEASIELNKNELALRIGDEENLTATVVPEGTEVIWTSSNTSVVTVTNGKITAVALGTATITATAGEKTATCTVTVPGGYCGDPSVNSGKNVTWSLQDGVLTISGEGAMGSQTGNNLSPWVGQKANITSVVVEDGVTSIGAYAFSQKYSKLATVTLAASAYAFNNDAALKTINLEKVKTIGESAFMKCTSLSSVDLSSATQIGKAAFGQCTGLTKVEGFGAAAIEDNAFLLCNKLAEADLKNVKSIGACAFSGTVLTSVDLSSAESIGRSAFSSTRVPTTAAAVTTLKTVVLGNNLKDTEVLVRHTLVAHVATHTEALEHLCGVRTSTD